MSATAKARTAENPALAQSIGNFKKWCVLRQDLSISRELITAPHHNRHGSNIGIFQHAVICALDLAHKPTNVDNEVLYVGCQLQFNHADLPPDRKYTIRGGFVMTMDETREVLQKNGGADILESGIAASNHMRKKGCLGVATMLLKAHDIVDVVKVILPSLDVARRIQAEDDWGKDWVSQYFRFLIERHS